MATLKAINLEATDLERADLEWADLQGANLRRADLHEANLRGVKLRGANLEKANLVGVRGLDEAEGLDEVKSWRGAKLERKWVDRLGLNAEKLGLEVVDDLEDDDPEEEEPRADAGSG